MKRAFLLVVAGLLFLLASTMGLAQQTQRINYRITNYFRIAPDKAAAMLNEARTTERKLMQERMASSENITMWVLLREAYRGIPASPYSYAISVGFDGAPQAPNVAKQTAEIQGLDGMGNRASRSSGSLRFRETAFGARPHARA